MRDIDDGPRNFEPRSRLLIRYSTLQTSTHPANVRSFTLDKLNVFSTTTQQVFNGTRTRTHDPTILATHKFVIKTTRLPQPSIEQKERDGDGKI
ncbi:hypothetical protein TNCV_575041 [Trichonephila clavipes]|nr:hypothetical protein TNCV_575041 [Trichonephila clavipes]